MKGTITDKKHKKLMKIVNNNDDDRGWYTMSYHPKKAGLARYSLDMSEYPNRILSQDGTLEWPNDSVDNYNYDPNASQWRLYMNKAPSYTEIEKPGHTLGDD